MLRDLRHGARLLLHDKGWTPVVVLSLALGIGANTALFSAVNGLSADKCPVRDPDTLVRLRWAGQQRHGDRLERLRLLGEKTMPAGQTCPHHVLLSDVPAVRRRQPDDGRSRSRCAPYGRAQRRRRRPGRHRAARFVSSGNYYQVLGVGARLGRTIVPDDDRADGGAGGGDQLEVLAHALRQRIPDVVGKDDRDQQRAGHDRRRAAAGVHRRPAAVGEPPDISLPLALEPQLETPASSAGVAALAQPTYWWLQVMGRLKPGVTAAQVQGNLDGVFQHTARAGLDAYSHVAARRKRERSSRNRNRTRGAAAAGRAGRRGIYDVNTNDLAVGHDPERRRRRWCC